MPRCKVAGFTVIELMIALAIMSLLLGVAAPAFNGMVASQRVKTATLDLHASLLQARSEAVKRNGTVRIRPPAGSDDWADGWVIPNPQTPNSDSNPLFQSLPSAGLEITSDAAYFDFRASGRVESDIAANGDGEFLLQIASATDSSKKRCLAIGLAGRARSVPCPDTDGDDE
ncbi:GspH/FimT family pseudopilin [Pseudomonas stutzeri]|nr:GspH/FimT family pseudopilin [Stutzerimonas stutzeri]